MPVLARDVMTSNPSACQEDSTIFDAVEIMEQENCGVVPITDVNERLIGIVTDRDICLRVVLDQLDPLDTVVGDVMHTDLLTCRETDDMADVIHQMEKRQVKRVPVVDDTGRCIGIISERDIAQCDALSPDQVNEFTEEVYK